MAGFQVTSPAALEREAAARAASRKRRTRWAWAFALALLALLAWAFGYAQGYFDGWAGRSAAIATSKES